MNVIGTFGRWPASVAAAVLVAVGAGSLIGACDPGPAPRERVGQVEQADDRCGAGLRLASVTQVCDYATTLDSFYAFRATGTCLDDAHIRCDYSAPCLFEPGIADPNECYSNQPACPKQTNPGNVSTSWTIELQFASKLCDPPGNASDLSEWCLNGLGGHLPGYAVPRLELEEYCYDQNMGTASEVMCCVRKPAAKDAGGDGAGGAGGTGGAGGAGGSPAEAGAGGAVPASPSL
jgi:hypothetical protein